MFEMQLKQHSGNGTTSGPIRSPVHILLVVPIADPGITQSLSEIYKSTSDTMYTFLDGSGLPPAVCPPCVDSMTSGIQSATCIFPLVLGFISGSATAVDGILVCCFSDHPLVNMLREQDQTVSIPVMGIFEVGIHAALMMGKKFGIVTTNYVWEDMLTASVENSGMGKESRFAGVVATGLGVLELETKPREEVLSRLRECGMRLVRRGAKCILLGCAGMAVFEEGLLDMLPPDVKVIDGVKYGICLLAALVRAQQ